MPKIRDLSAEDLARWRVASADKELVQLAFPGLSVEEARRALLSHYKILNDLLRDYDVAPDDNAGIYVSPIDGGIYAVSSQDFFEGMG